MKCEMCERTVKDGPLFRVNPKGVPGKWACQEHVNHYDVEVGDEVRMIVDAVHMANVARIDLTQWVCRNCDWANHQLRLSCRNCQCVRGTTRRLH